MSVKEYIDQLEARIAQLEGAEIQLDVIADYIMASVHDVAFEGGAGDVAVQVIERYKQGWDAAVDLCRAKDERIAQLEAALRSKEAG